MNVAELQEYLSRMPDDATVFLETFDRVDRVWYVTYVEADSLNNEKAVVIGSDEELEENNEPDTQ